VELVSPETQLNPAQEGLLRRVLPAIFRTYTNMVSPAPQGEKQQVKELPDLF
jgi:hypothetical protein